MLTTQKIEKKLKWVNKKIMEKKNRRMRGGKLSL